MTIENDGVETSETNEELDLDLEETVEQDDKETQREEKPKESPEAKLARLKRQTAQLEKKLGTKEPETKQESKSEKSSDLDYGQKAYLNSLLNVKGADELAYTKEFIANTGKTLDDLVENKFYLNGLSELREAKASKEALPSGTKRSSTTTKDNVDYWVEKYNNGTAFQDIPENMQMKVLNAKVAKDKQNSKFTSNPVVGA